MRLLIHEDYGELSRWTASCIASAIKKFNPGPDKPFVLGLPTGSSPVGTYEELISLHKKGDLSFENVVTFNMDEYVGIPEDHPESYHSFMRKNLFDHVDIPDENVNILDGNAADLKAECAGYEKKIEQYGGIRLFLGGMGADGHLAFNEPGSSLCSRTRVKSLTCDTIAANSRFFGGDVDKVPKSALTVGIGTVMDAEQVVLVVNGHNKARALRMCVEGGINHMWTASILQMHPRAVIVCDEEASGELRADTVKYFKDIEKDNISPASS
ncbi:MAG: glucosamine-6-phosphate deaminase [Kiritimatiellia bacterium]